MAEKFSLFDLVIQFDDRFADWRHSIDRLPSARGPISFPLKKVQIMSPDSNALSIKGPICSVSAFFEKAYSSALDFVLVDAKENHGGDIIFH